MSIFGHFIESGLIMIRYHHILKSYWLDGKRNWRIDHVIYVLTQEMEPELYKARHNSQQIGFQGEDLAGRHRRSILTNSQHISGNSITPLDSNRFHVASQTQPGRKYVVDTQEAICDCPDFPRIRFCKHLAAVQSKSLPSAQEMQGVSIQPQNATQIPSTRAPDSFSSGEASQLSVAGEGTKFRAPGTQLQALPNRERLIPNCNLWKETARNMHATRKSPKQHQPPVPSSTTQRIGPIGKRKFLFTDPYSGGEKPGKHAKADALSASANAHFRSLATSEGQNV
jgi:hypothetical protein